jgi:hypothetical protein
MPERSTSAASVCARRRRWARLVRKLGHEVRPDSAGPLVVHTSKYLDEAEALGAGGGQPSTSKRSSVT